jgi:carboxyl-terminal processing protease
VKNDGTAPAWRVHARIQADDYVFEDTELPFGKLGPGESKTFATKIKLPKDAVDRLDRLTLEVREARNAPVVVTPASLRVEAAKRPVFAYQYQLIDEGNGDGLIQKKEAYRLIVTLKNTGAGTAAEATALLRNASGDGVVLDKSRFELGELKPGDTRVVEFPFAVTPKLKGNEMVVEVLMYDNVLGAQATEKLRFAVRPSVGVVESRGTVEVRGKQAEIRSGAASDSPLVGTAAGKARFAVLATVGPWTKVDLGNKRVGFIAGSSLNKGAGGAPQFAWQPVWHSTPPALALTTRGFDTTLPQYRLEGRVSDDTHVEDVYIYVSNQSSKIDGRKVFYRSNRSGKNGKQLDFATDIPLWPGSNQITVVARENADVKTVQTLYIYREAPRTAAAKP